MPHIHNPSAENDRCHFDNQEARLVFFKDSTERKFCWHVLVAMLMTVSIGG
jgi:hypothetical protein